MNQLIEKLIQEISSLELDEKISAINEVKKELHKISPFKSEPVDCVLWIKNEFIYANDYNPNSVAPPEMKLLHISISEDGYTQPIVSMIDENGNREVVDGFHRHRVGKEYDDVRDRVFSYLPVVAINENRTDKSDRIASTIRHNRARGKHKVTAMSDIVLELKKRNWSDEKIGKNLGMDPDEVLRLTQISGLAEMFADKEFSMSWEVESIDETDNLEITEENTT
jgi:ParB-like chromosome segregation protein Spo0J